MTQLSDEILIAYADGELGAEQVRLVDNVLAGDTVAMGRFRQQLAINKRLKQAFSSMLEAGGKRLAADQARQASVQPVPQQAQGDPVVKSSGHNFLMPAAAAGIVLVALGALGGYFAGNSSGDGAGARDPFRTADFWNKEQVKAEADRARALFQNVEEPVTTAATQELTGRSLKKWFEAVALRHKRDADGLIGNYEGKSRNPELALFQFSRTDIAPSMIPVLREEKLTFVGASPVQIGGQSYARLTYREPGNGALPFAIYVGKASGGSLTLERGYLENDNYVRWTQGDRSYMLIGAVPHWRLIVLSVAVQRQLVR